MPKITGNSVLHDIPGSGSGAPGAIRIKAPPRIQSDGQVAQTKMPRLGPEYFGADVAQSLSRLGQQGAEIAGVIAAEEERSRLADHAAKQMDLTTDAAMSLAELRNTANETGTHEDYRSIVDKGVEKIQKDIETKAGGYGFSQQSMLQLRHGSRVCSIKRRSTP